MDAKSAAKALAASMKRTLAAFGWPAKTLARSYGEGKWTGKQILGHLTDCELVFLTRLEYMLAEERPTVVSFEQDLWAKRFDYGSQDLKAMKGRFRALREAFIALARTLSEADWARKANRPDNPNYDVGYLVTHADEHTVHHLEQLEAIRKGKRWPGP